MARVTPTALEGTGSVRNANPDPAHLGILVSAKNPDGTPYLLPVASSSAATVPVAYEQIAVAAAGGSAIGLTPPGTAILAMIVPSVAVRWRDDGTSPTAALGMPLPAGQELFYDAALSAVQFIGQVAAGVLDVSYYAAA